MTPRQRRTTTKPGPAADARAPVTLSDPRDIRALAHPARMVVIDEIYSGRELTATECAEIAGLSPSAMSYHLRALERAGIVERSDHKGDGRERPWRAAGPYLHIESTAGAGGIAATAALTEQVLGRTLVEFNRWMASRGTESADWRKKGGSSSGQVWLLPDEAEAIQQHLVDELEPYRGRNAERHPAGARRVGVTLLVFPTDDRKGPREPS